MHGQREEYTPHTCSDWDGCTTSESSWNWQPTSYVNGSVLGRSKQVSSLVTELNVAHGTIVVLAEALALVV